MDVFHISHAEDTIRDSLYAQNSPNIDTLRHRPVHTLCCENNLTFLKSTKWVYADFGIHSGKAVKADKRKANGYSCCLSCIRSQQIPTVVTVPSQPSAAAVDL